jgi:hypothetical protein
MILKKIKNLTRAKTPFINRALNSPSPGDSRA